MIGADLSAAENRVLEQLGHSPKTAREIGKASGLANGRLYGALNSLASAGIVQKSSYVPSMAGQHALDPETKYGWVLSRKVD